MGTIFKSTTSASAVVLVADTAALFGFGAGAVEGCSAAAGNDCGGCGSATAADARTGVPGGVRSAASLALDDFLPPPNVTALKMRRTVGFREPSAVADLNEAAESVLSDLVAFVAASPSPPPLSPLASSAQAPLVGWERNDFVGTRTMDFMVAFFERFAVLVKGAKPHEASGDEGAYPARRTPPVAAFEAAAGQLLSRARWRLTCHLTA